MKLDDVTTELRQLQPILSQKYFVKRVGVFGSLVHGDNTKSSDIDIVVSFSQPIGFFQFVELEKYLSERLGCKVDLVSEKGLKPIVKDQILEETVYV